MSINPNLKITKVKRILFEGLSDYNSRDTDSYTLRKEKYENFYVEKQQGICDQWKRKKRTYKHNENVYKLRV